MVEVLAAAEREPLGHGPFRIRRVRPGRVLGRREGDLALGPLAAIDHATLDRGAFVAMHEHVDDEILSYLWRGTMVHEDSAGHRVPLSGRRLMLMNAGRGFRHEESVPDDAVEMLQIFVRPRAAGLEPGVQFWEPPDDRAGAWRLVAGPEGGGAPLAFRQGVTVLDAAAGAGAVLPSPAQAGLTPFVYVLHGAVRAGGVRAGKGDALAGPGGELPSLEVVEDAALVAFLVDVAAPASRAGTISGR